MAPTHGHPAEIITTQIYSRSGIGFLWNKRNELDQGQVAIINSIYNNRKKGALQPTQTITYRLARTKAGQLGYGRYYGTKGSLETLEREVRGTLCREYYHDIDIVNAHPVILSQFAHMRGHDLPANENYVANRDQVLASINPNRDEAKQEVIRVLYGGVNRYPATAALSKEIRAFSKSLSADPNYKALWDSVQSEDNKYGTFLSYILQTEERRCMLAMKESLEANGWSVDVLAYDGVMVRKRGADDPLLGAAITAATAAIKDATGYDVQLICKDFSYYEVPTHDEEMEKGVLKSAYEAMRADFERTHFYHIPSNQIAEVCPNGEIMFMKTDHAHAYLSSKFFFRHSDKFQDYTPFLPLWVKDTARRCVRVLDFAPSDNPEVFQLPLNFAYKTATGDPPNAVPTFLELLGILADGEQLNYLLNWLAHLLQKPLENPKVAIVATGIKGCGKDTPFDFFIQYVLGYLYGISYCDNNQFFAPHDTGRMNKFLVKLEEADRNACMRNASTLKGIITTDVVTYNPKGVKEIQAANYCRYVFTTNKGNPFEMTDGERRFLVLNAKATKKGDVEFWKRVRADLFNPAAGKAIAEYLLARDISDWVIQTIPMTEYQQAIVESEKTSEQRFLEEWSGEPVNGTEFFTLYRDFFIDNNLPYAANSIALGKRLLPLLRDGLLVKQHTKEGSVYMRPI